MILISRARHEREMASLRAKTAQLRKKLDQAIDERDAFKAAAKTAAQQFTTADDQRQQLADAEVRREALATVRGERLIEGGYPTPTPLTIRARRDRERAHKLDGRLAELEAINARCTCGGAA